MAGDLPSGTGVPERHLHLLTLLRRLVLVGGRGTSGVQVRQAQQPASTAGGGGGGRLRVPRFPAGRRAAPPGRTPHISFLWPREE